jgi:Ca-activated chloride channel family protein
MLAQDVSGSMKATDVPPSRLAAARNAAANFVDSVPSSVRVGLLEFATGTTVLQSPSFDHALTLQALKELKTDGGTAMNAALTTALHQLTSLRSSDGKRVPGAIVMLSDGASDIGPSPLTAAKQAAADHIPIYTIALGTEGGTVAVKRGSTAVNVPVPPSPQELAQIASVSGGRTFTAADLGGLRAVYAHLAAQLGHKQVKEEISSSFAGGGLVLLLFGSVMSLRWFGRLV